MGEWVWTDRTRTFLWPKQFFQATTCSNCLTWRDLGLPESHANRPGMTAGVRHYEKHSTIFLECSCVFWSSWRSRLSCWAPRNPHPTKNKRKKTTTKKTTNKKNPTYIIRNLGTYGLRLEWGFVDGRHVVRFWNLVDGGVGACDGRFAVFPSSLTTDPGTSVWCRGCRNKALWLVSGTAALPLLAFCGPSVSSRHYDLSEVDFSACSNISFPCNIPREWDELCIGVFQKQTVERKKRIFYFRYTFFFVDTFFSATVSLLFSTFVYFFN